MAATPQPRDTCTSRQNEATDDVSAFDLRVLTDTDARDGRAGRGSRHIYLRAAKVEGSVGSGFATARDMPISHDRICV